MLEELLRFLLYGMPGWVTMTIAVIGCLNDDQENKLLDSAEDE